MAARPALSSCRKTTAGACRSCCMSVLRRPRLARTGSPSEPSCVVVSDRAGSARDSAMFPEAHPGACPRALLRIPRDSSFQSSGFMAVRGQGGIQVHHRTPDVRGAAYKPILAGSDCHFVVVCPYCLGQRAMRRPSLNRQCCVRDRIRAVWFRGQCEQAMQRRPRPAAQVHSTRADCPDSCFGPPGHAHVSACVLSCLGRETSGSEPSAGLPAKIGTASWGARSARAISGRTHHPRTRRFARGVVA
jgi:hypothetical protein